MANLATSADGGPVLARDLSAHAGVPLTYLSKILGSLTKAGILRANRGPGGGYRLARDAAEIHLMDIVEQFDGLKTKPNCLFRSGRMCSDENPCTGHVSFKRVRQGYIEFLESTTIADIAGPSHTDGAPMGCLFPDLPAGQQG
jgi:Rrf2 family iron-sulfur cluster assembly transcriptional regulator